jgi:hypothetical protein
LANKSKGKKLEVASYYVCCPNCKVTETLWFLGGELIATKRFAQKNGGIFHDCGSKQPCRVF